MITPIINFRHKSNSSSKVQPYRPFFRFNKISDSYSFKGSVGYIDSENSRNLDTLSRAYKEVMALLELKTDEGIKKVENDVPNLKLWKGITFSNFGDEKKSVYLNIPQSKKAGNVIKFVLSDKKTKKEKTYLIKDFSMVIKDPSVKSPSEFEYLSNAEIERYGINKDLKNLLEDLDPLILKLRIAVQKRSEQDLKPPTAILDEKLSQKLRNIKLLNSEVDSIFREKVRREDYRQAYEVWYAENSRLFKGQPAVPFTFENIQGDSVSLSDFRGKYVYIDVWATWCVPCNAEIPALQRLEKEFEGKNICFVSISCDDSRETWKRFVKSKKLGGVQLFMGNEKSYMEQILCKGVPRFLLIDREGRFVNANMTRPSDPRTEETLRTLEGI